MGEAALFSDQIVIPTQINGLISMKTVIYYLFYVYSGDLMMKSIQKMNMVTIISRFPSPIKNTHFNYCLYK